MSTVGEGALPLIMSHPPSSWNLLACFVVMTAVYVAVMPADVPKCLGLGDKTGVACDNGQCKLDWEFCDGNIDCDDASDETTKGRYLIDVCSGREQGIS